MSQRENDVWEEQNRELGDEPGALTCLRCEGSWVPRGLEPPANCPRCNSPAWDRPRVGNSKAAKAKAQLLAKAAGLSKAQIVEAFEDCTGLPQATFSSLRCRRREHCRPYWLLP